MRIRILPFTLMWIRIRIRLIKLQNKGSEPWKSAQIGLYSIHFGLSSANWCGSGSSLLLSCGSGSASSWSLWCDSDPDPTFQFDADPCGSGSATLRHKYVEFLHLYNVLQYGIGETRTEYVLWYTNLHIASCSKCPWSWGATAIHFWGKKRGKNEMQNWPDISWRNLAQLYALNSSRAPAKKVTAVGSCFVNLILKTSYMDVICIFKHVK